MSTLIDTIKSDNLKARQQKLSAVSSLLTTLIGEAEMIGKNAGNRQPTDAEVQTLIRKFIKNNNETISALGDQDPRSLAFMGENHTLEKYLPIQMNTEQLVATVRGIVTGLKIAQTPKIDMGAVMKILKERFDGQYDGKAASMIIKVEIAQ